MKKNIGIILAVNLLISVLFTSCGLGNSETKLPDHASKESVPPYSKLITIELDEEDIRPLVSEILGDLPGMYTTEISWSKDPGNEIIEQFDARLSEEEWQLDADWITRTGFDNIWFSTWEKDNLQLFVVVYDHLTNEDINSLNNRFGISGPPPGSSLVIRILIDRSHPLPGNTSTALEKNQKATGTKRSTPVFTSTPSPTTTPTHYPFIIPTQTNTIAPWRTKTFTATATCTNTPVFTPTTTNTSSPTVLPTSTSTFTATPTPTSTFTPTFTPTPTSTSTETFTPSPTSTFTATSTPTVTSTPSVTPTK